MNGAVARIPHTPGPWHWEGEALHPAEKSANVSIIMSDEGAWVPRDCDVNAMRAEIEANKRLMAAAPELLSELKSARTELRILHDDHVYSSTDRHPDDCALCKQIASMDALIDRIEVAA